LKNIEQYGIVFYMMMIGIYLKILIEDFINFEVNEKDIENFINDLI